MTYIKVMVQIITSRKPVDYEAALQEMEARVRGIIDGEQSEALWLLEHKSIITAGTSAKADDVLSDEFPVYETGRGGENTYHGPGQRIAYVMVNLAKRDAKDVKQFIYNLEEWIIQTLAEFNIKGERREGRVGIWVALANGKEEKIAAIGIRLRKWVSFHGVSVNINPDLSHYRAIVPCGIAEHGVTSFKKLGLTTDMNEFDEVLVRKFIEIFS